MESDYASVVTQEDGNVLYRDNAGNVTYAQDRDGNAIAVPGAAGSSIVQQFASLIDFGVRSAINRSNTRTTVQAQAAAQVPTQAQSYGTLILLGLGALFAYKALAK